MAKITNDDIWQQHVYLSFERYNKIVQKGFDRYVLSNKTRDTIYARKNWYVAQTILKNMTLFCRTYVCNKSVYLELC